MLEILNTNSKTSPLANTYSYICPHCTGGPQKHLQEIWLYMDRLMFNCQLQLSKSFCPIQIIDIENEPGVAGAVL